MKHLFIAVFIILVLAFSGKAQIEAGFYVDTNFVCIGVPVVFTDTSSSDTSVVSSWAWDFSDGYTSTEQNPVHVFDSVGAFTIKLKVRDDNNLVDQIIRYQYVTVREQPTAAFTILDSILSDSYSRFFMANNPDNGTYQFQWDFGDSQSIESEKILHTYAEEGSYNVRMVMISGKECRDTTEQTIDIADAFEVPGAFTPNGDGVNDVFYVNSNGYNTITLRILNRWGQLVYIDTAKKVFWDGRNVAGVEMQPGVYFYIITEENGDTRYESKGYIHLYR